MPYRQKLHIYIIWVHMGLHLNRVHFPSSCYHNHKFMSCFVITCRVFSDRLVDDKDMESFVAILTEKLGLLFDQTFHNICPGKQPPIFGKNSLISAFFLS